MNPLDWIATAGKLIASAFNYLTGRSNAYNTKPMIDSDQAKKETNEDDNDAKAIQSGNRDHVRDDIG